MRHWSKALTVTALVAATAVPAPAAERHPAATGAERAGALPVDISIDIIRSADEVSGSTRVSVDAAAEITLPPLRGKGAAATAGEGPDHPGPAAGEPDGNGPPVDLPVEPGAPEGAGLPVEVPTPDLPDVVPEGVVPGGPPVEVPVPDLPDVVPEGVVPEGVVPGGPPVDVPVPDLPDVVPEGVVPGGPPVEVPAHGPPDTAPGRVGR